MRGGLNFIQGNLSLLRQMNWVDEQTRAVFVEFSVYNPNINLVMVSTILVEFLSSGTILTAARFDPLNLFNESDGISFKTICEIIFAAFIFYYAYEQIKEAVNKDLKEYIKDFWSYIEWSIILTAFISLAMILVRLRKAQEVLDFFRATAGFGYMKLQTANECNQVLSYFLGLCSSFGTIKFLKMLRFNKNVSHLGMSLKLCMGELISFSFVFFLIWIAFVQWMYLMYGSYVYGYLSFVKSMDSAFQIILGKNDTTQFFDISPILGPLIYVTYFMAVICFGLNIFITIITNAFDMVRLCTNESEDLNDYYFYALKKFKSLLCKTQSLKSKTRYRDQFSTLPKNVNRLINFIYRVN
jgi:hypothetical protein